MLARAESVYKRIIFSLPVIETGLHLKSSVTQSPSINPSIIYQATHLVSRPLKGRDAFFSEAHSQCSKEGGDTCLVHFCRL